MDGWTLKAAFKRTVSERWEGPRDRQSSRKCVECVSVCACVSETRLAPERATEQDLKNGRGGGGRGYDLYGSQTQGGDGDILAAAS